MKNNIKIALFLTSLAMPLFPDASRETETSSATSQEAVSPVAPAIVPSKSLKITDRVIEDQTTQQKIAEMLKQLSAQQPVATPIAPMAPHKISAKKLRESSLPQQEPLAIKRQRVFLPQVIRNFLKPHQQKASSTFNVTPQPFKNLTGVVYPPEIYNIINQLRQENSPLLHNRLLLYGPPGNGKTALARAIADETGCYFMALPGPHIVTSYMGDGPKNVKTKFEDAIKHYNETGQRVVIFIDEIDSISRSINGESAARLEHHQATAAVWTALDEYRAHPGIFLIGATNHFDKLDQTMLARFASNTLEITNPDALARKNILDHYLALNKVSLDTQLLRDLVAKTEGLSIRDLEYLVKDLAAAPQLYGPENVSEDTVWEILKKTKKKYLEAKRPEPFTESKLSKAVAWCSLVTQAYTICFQIIPAMQKQFAPAYTLHLNPPL